MNISWLEVALGFFALAYVALQATCQAAIGFHGLTITILSVSVFFYALTRGFYALIQFCLRRDRKVRESIND